MLRIALVLGSLLWTSLALAQAPSSLPGCQYNATPPTLSDKQQTVWQCDINGKLITSSTATGDVVGPGSATDNAVVRFDGTTGKLIQNSLGILSDTGVLTGLTNAAIATGTITTSQPLTLTQTWNAGGVTFTGMLVNVTNTTSAAGSLLTDWQVGGVSQASIDKSGAILALGSISSPGGLLGTGGIETTATGVLAFSSTSSVFGSADVILRRDAANTLALRNGVNAQTFNVYNTYTDASNFERGTVSWITNVLFFGTGKAGTGTARDAALYADSGLQFWALGARVWNINSSGHILAQTDNTYDIGASGATRPRNVYVGTAVVAGGYVVAGAGSGLALASKLSIKSPSDGIAGIYNAAENDFSRLQFGGTTSSFPALKRSTTILQVRLADDSANAPLEAKTLDTDGFAVASLPTGATGMRAYVTDQLTTCPVLSGTFTGGGAVVCSAFYNGTAWVHE